MGDASMQHGVDATLVEKIPNGEILISLMENTMMIVTIEMTPNFLGA